MMTSTRLQQFAARLRSRTGGREDVRPFVCDGDPYASTAFVIGFNPASTLPDPFWGYWTDEYGFDKRRWLDAYQSARRVAGKHRISNTRQRLEWLAEGAKSVRILETNLFALATPKQSDLRLEDHPFDLLDFLLEEIRPRAVLLHGKRARIDFERRYGYPLKETFASIPLDGRHCMVAAVKHARFWSRDSALRWGRNLQALLGSP